MPQTNRAADRRSPEAAIWRKLYTTKDWQALKADQLAKQPLCDRCLRLEPERLTVATIVNHKKPHRGDRSLFFDPENLESSCKPHHDSAIQREERLGYVIGCDARGRPLDPHHPWNRKPPCRSV